MLQVNTFSAKSKASEVLMQKAAHIQLSSSLPGIMGLFRTFPESAKPMEELAELLLTKESSTFSKAERETVASYVSYLNACVFCSESHAAVADFHWQSQTAKQVWENPEGAPISDRLKSLLRIAGKVQRSALQVSQEDVAKAIENGATERDVHDTVLIAAAFCMFNRYVDGLGTLAPSRGDKSYQEAGQMLGQCGYLKPIL
jgi:uncharacterized peroxidase-related enzyme